MASAGSIFVDLLLRDAKYTEGWKRAESTTKSSLDGIKGSLATVFGAGTFVALTKSALDTAARIKDVSESLGLSTAQLQSYEYAAKLSSVSTDQLQTAIQFLNKQIASGHLGYKNTNDALLDLSDKVKNAKTNLEKTAIVVDAFGAKGGQRLIPFLADGSDGLRRLSEEAQNLGIILDEGTINAAEKFGDQVDILGSVIKDNFQQGLLSAFASDSATIRDIYSDPNFISGIKTIGEVFGAITKAVLLGASKFGEYTQALGQLYARIASADNPDIFNALDEITTEGGKPPKLPAANHLGAGSPAGPTSADKKALDDRKKAIDSINDSLTKQTVLLSVENDYFNEGEVALDRQKKIKEILFDLDAKHIQLTDQERENLENKLDLLDEEKQRNLDLKFDEKARADAAKAFADQQAENAKRLEDSQQTIREDLAGALTDSLLGAKSLSQAFRDVAKSIAESVIKAQLLDAITSNTGGSTGNVNLPWLNGGGGGGGGGGGLGGLFGSLFSWLPSFDVGSYRVPQDTLAMVHKDEMIIPAGQAGGMRNGNWGGSSVTMNVYTQDANSFKASDRQIARSLKTRVAGA